MCFFNLVLNLFCSYYVFILQKMEIIRKKLKVIIMPNRFFTSKQKNLETHEHLYFEDVKVKIKLKDNIQFIKGTLGNSSDLIIREFTVGKVDIAVIYIEGISNKDFIDNYLLSNLMIFINNNDFDNSYDIYSNLIQNQLNVSQLEECSDYKLLFKNLLYGNAIVLIDNLKVGFSLGTKYIDDRAVSVPDSEYSSKGPKDSFIETLRINTAAIRNRIKDVNLRMDSYTVGKITNTDVVVSYIKGNAPDNIVNEVKRRIEAIDIDALTDSSYLKKVIRDQKYNIFPVSGSTERPDLICAKLLEGRVVIIVDGTPFVIFVPYFFKDIFKSTEEYYQTITVSLFIRFLRYIAFFLTIFTAPIFVALGAFHQEMLPISILLSFIIQYENISTPLFHLYTPFSLKIVFKCIFNSLKWTSILNLFNMSTIIWVYSRQIIHV